MIQTSKHLLLSRRLLLLFNEIYLWSRYYILEGGKKPQKKVPKRKKLDM